ncbi:hypothetical protein EDB85DRAFT_2279935 [Lactarius pseudohatsudake]|nr:hypothetical protein EDB85DRAFT_2279935 [Lactarius pseudohatsudake]
MTTCGPVNRGTVKHHKALNAKAARECGGVGTAGYTEPEGRVVASNWKWSRTLRRGTKLCVHGRQGRERVGFELLRTRASAACWACKGRCIEATCIDSLRNFHRKAKTVDASFDPRAEPTTTRAAWDTSLQKPAQQASVDILDNDVIKSLRTLKVSQEYLVLEGTPVLMIRPRKKTKDETRKRIEEDLWHGDCRKVC